MLQTVLFSQMAELSAVWYMHNKAIFHGRQKYMSKCFKAYFKPVIKSNAMLFCVKHMQQATSSFDFCKIQNKMDDFSCSFQFFLAVGIQLLHNYAK